MRKPKHLNILGKVADKMANKRKNARVGCTVPVESKAGSVFEDTKTVDLSRSGLGLVSHKYIPVDKEIFIEIALDEEAYPVLVLGKVLWVRSLDNSNNYRVGVNFKDVLKGSKTRLHKYLKK